MLHISFPYSCLLGGGKCCTYWISLGIGKSQVFAIETDHASWGSKPAYACTAAVTVYLTLPWHMEWNGMGFIYNATCMTRHDCVMMWLFHCFGFTLEHSCNLTCLCSQGYEYSRAVHIMHMFEWTCWHCMHTYTCQPHTRMHTRMHTALIKWNWTSW